MKNKKTRKLFVFVPAALAVLFMLYSFVLKEKETGNKTTEGTKSGPLNIVYRSTDGGETWQNISRGLPENLQKGGLWSHGLFANANGLYLRAGNGVYHSAPNSTTTFWTKETLFGEQREIAPANNGIFVYDFRGRFLKNITGKSDWLPMYTNFQEQAVRLNGTLDWMYKNYKEKQVSSVFETTGGTVFIGSNNAIYKSANNGKTWKYVPVGGWVTKMVESNGVLMAASSHGILKSTDDGETWERVIGEGVAGNTAEHIDGGFAVIAHSAITKTDKGYISLDNGKTWNDVGAGLPSSWSFKNIFETESRYISSIKQAGKYLICDSSDGAFRSADMGKTWEKITLPSVENKGFSLAASGNVIYAMPNKGC